MADAPPAQGNGLMSFLPMLAFLAILYFLLVRPQQKRTKEHRALIASVKKGDKVVTSCGILATVSKIVSDQEVVLEIADGVYCKFVKSAISNVVSTETQPPVAIDAKGDAGQVDADKATKSTDEKLEIEKNVAKSAKSESPVKRKTSTKK
jgi:preprotein translocase subunit YajC